MGKQQLHGVKSHRDQGKVPDGTNYEAMEGARAESAVREANCQVLSNCGGAAVSIPKLTSSGNVFAKSSAAKTEVDAYRRKPGGGSV